MIMPPLPVGFKFNLKLLTQAHAGTRASGTPAAGRHGYAYYYY